VEILDIVDSYDHVIGTSDKVTAIKKGLITRVSFVILLNSNNELYLQQRKSTKKTYPLYWSGSAAGHVRSNESYLEAAERELDEELGVRAKLHSIGKIFSAADQEFATFFIGSSQGPFKLEERAIERAEYFSLRSIKTNKNSIKMTSYLIAAIPLVEKYLGRK
jgi:isopentenyl-diphosphate Delta-isomerase